MDKRTKEMMNLCACMTEQKGKWVILEEKGHKVRRYLCRRCGKGIYLRQE